jgi:hypothetical protein
MRSLRITPDPSVAYKHLILNDLAELTKQRATNYDTQCTGITITNPNSQIRSASASAHARHLSSAPGSGGGAIAEDLVSHS